MGRGTGLDHRWKNHPGVLVHGIRDPSDLWAKLDWEVDQFEQARYGTAPDAFAMSFLAANISITLNSLKDWFSLRLVRESRNGDDEGIRPIQAGTNARWREDAVKELVRARIQHADIFTDIANTAKHGAYRTTSQLDLHARLTPRFPAALAEELDRLDDELGAAFILRHWDRADWQLTYRTGEDEPTELDALRIFSAARGEWAILLTEFGYLDS